MTPQGTRGRRPLCILIRFTRWARDSLYGSLLQLWDRISIHWLTVCYAVLLSSFFLSLAWQLTRMEPRAEWFEREMREQKLLPPLTRDQ